MQDTSVLGKKRCRPEIEIIFVTSRGRIFPVATRQTYGVILSGFSECDIGGTALREHRFQRLIYVISLDGNRENGGKITRQYHSKMLAVLLVILRFPRVFAGGCAGEPMAFELLNSLVRSAPGNS